jgi:hypothetical protein
VNELGAGFLPGHKEAMYDVEFPGSVCTGNFKDLGRNLCAFWSGGRFQLLDLLKRLKCIELDLTECYFMAGFGPAG